MKLPLEELFDASGPVVAERRQNIGVSELRERMRAGPTLVIAEVGQPLSWIPREDTFEVWKKQLSARIFVPRTAVRPDELPGGHGYRASEWALADGTVVLVFERMH